MAEIRAADVEIRPLRAADADAVVDAAYTAIAVIYPEPDWTPDERAIAVAGGRARVLHLLDTDPSGCWVAEHDGRVVGTALGLIRDGVWGFSLFALLPDFQGRGIGTRLYAPALDYGASEPGGIILSTPHPAAMRRYARSDGYRLLPAVRLTGAWNAARLPDGLRARPGDLEADAGTIEAASRFVRGASHMRDLPTLLEQRPGVRLLVVDGEGFAVARDGETWLLAARSETAAEDLLWSVFVSGPRGGSVEVNYVTAENQWAIRVGLEAGLVLSPDGPTFVRGDVGPMAPYLPSGAYL
jgi:GNAT superfamily N-acetyltransferase